MSPGSPDIPEAEDPQPELRGTCLVASTRVWPVRLATKALTTKEGSVSAKNYTTLRNPITIAWNSARQMGTRTSDDFGAAAAVKISVLAHETTYSTPASNQTGA
ncbi:uncharacterized protein DNG_00516 [Cephalotrichum gorgonifer]|uniref:Uncharacterized protein n=1 Tax=Cephalotrichum gorgonifer TaxID=2041049 RepID=A0AAE8SQW3_9PEZI|nr:uncharacterized protein DNG_00516 [Cephalotrichum gorgonifer]